MASKSRMEVQKQEELKAIKSNLVELLDVVSKLTKQIADIKSNLSQLTKELANEK